MTASIPRSMASWATAYTFAADNHVRNGMRGQIPRRTSATQATIGAAMPTDISVAIRQLWRSKRMSPTIGTTMDTIMPA